MSPLVASAHVIGLKIALGRPELFKFIHVGGVICGLVLLVAAVFMPESPAFLIYEDKKEEAEAAIRTFHPKYQR